MEIDYPASHSQDTTWFAVDKDGRVGYFESGEAGVVPVEALQGEPAVSMLSRLANALPRTEVLHDRQGQLRPASPPGREHRRAGSRETLPHVLLFLKSLDLVAGEIAAGRAQQMPSTSDFAVHFQELSAELDRQLHDSDMCLGCFWHWLGFDEGRVQPETFGFYQYDHTCENWVSGPYGRVSIPVNPVHVDQLPPQLRNALKAVRFDVNFAETTYIQPVADHECASWETQWLDLEGKEHPMPGREDDEE